MSDQNPNEFWIVLPDNEPGSYDNGQVWEMEPSSESEQALNHIHVIEYSTHELIKSDLEAQLHIAKNIIQDLRKERDDLSVALGVTQVKLHGDRRDLSALEDLNITLRAENHTMRKTLELYEMPTVEKLKVELKLKNENIDDMGSSIHSHNELIPKLEADLAVAIEALEYIANEVIFEPTDDLADCAKEALAKIRGGK